MDSFSIGLINSFILGEIHSIDLPNSRYYLNPYNLKITLIPTDFGEIKKLTYENSLPSNLNSSRLRIPFIEQLIYSEEFIESYLKNLKLFTNYSNDFNEKMLLHCKYFNSSCLEQYDYQTIDNNNKIILNKKEIQIYELQNFLIKKKDKLKNIIFNKNTDTKIKFGNYLDNFIHARVFNNGRIELYNLTPLNVKIENIKFYKNNCIENCSKIKNYNNYKIIPSSYNEITSNKLNLNFNIDQYDEYEFFTSINNEKKIFNGKIIDIKNNYSSNNTINKFDKIIFEINKTNIKLNKGNWKITEPIIIKDKDLIIDKDTILNFSKDSFIYIKGGNLKINENQSLNNFDAKHTTILRALNDDWLGIYVENENFPETSILNNVTIKDTKNFNHKTYNLMGGVNFYKSNILINNININNSKSEDQINFINSNFEIKNSKFSKSISDSIDSDFSKGIISDSTFEDINGDAIDTSGSKVKLKNISILNVFDKGLSIGEKSQVEGDNIVVKNSGVGIAIKDSSNLDLNNFSSYDSFIADVLSINKKNFFGRSYATIYSSTDINENKFIIGNENEIYFNDVLLPTEPIDASALYNSERMKKNAI